MAKIEKLLKKYELVLVLIAIIVVTWGLFYLFSHFVVSDFEDFMKLRFLTESFGLYTFFPGQHDFNAFHGHPGFHQFITYLYLGILGHSFGALMSLYGIVLMFILFGLYYLFYSVSKDWLLSSLLSTSFFLTPMFILSSTHYTHDHFALMLAIWGSAFYLTQRPLLSSIAFTFSCLSMESYIAFPLVFIAFDWMMHKKMKRLWIMFLPLVSIMIFFTWEFFATGNFSNSTVALVDWDEGSDEIIRNFEEIVEGGKILLKGYRSLFIAVSSIFIYSLWKKIKIDKRFYPFLFISFAFAVFYLLVNVNPLLEDFFTLSLTLHILLLFLLTKMKGVPRSLFITILLTLGILFFVKERRAYEEMYGQKWELLKKIPWMVNMRYSHCSISSEDFTQTILHYPFSGFVLNDQHKNVKKSEDCYLKYRNLLIYPLEDDEAPYVPDEQSGEELLEQGYQLKIREKDLVRALWKQGEEEVIYFELFELKK